MTNWNKCVLAALIVLIPCLTLSSAAGKSVVLGEPEHLLAGYYALENGAYPSSGGAWDIRFSGEVSAAFVCLFGSPVYLPTLTDRSQVPLHDLSIDFMTRNGLGPVVFWARLPFTILSVLLALLVFRVVKRFYGVRSGLVALFLYVLCPGILAYSRFCTADFTAMAAMFAASAAFVVYLEGRMWWMFAATAGALAVALLSSESMFILVPAFAVMMAVNWLLAPKGRLAAGSRLGSLARGAAIYCGMMLVTFIVIWAAYHFEMRPLLSPETKQNVLRQPRSLASLGALVGRDKANRLYGNAADFLERTKIPAGSFLRSAAMGILHPEPPQTYYLRGQYSSEGWWYYFPLAFLVKVPIPLIALFLMGLAAIFLRPAAGIRREVLLLIPPVLFFAAAIAWSPDRGFYQIIAVLPFVIVIASRLLARRDEGAGWTPSLAIVIVVAVLGLWYAIASFGIHPDYLTYFNEIAGGPGGGKDWLAATDADRGQDLPGLARFMADHGIKAVHLSYFGPADPALYNVAIHGGRQFTVPDGSPGSSPLAVKIAYKPSSGYVAVSLAHLQRLSLRDKTAFDWLKGTDVMPVANIGHTIYLYKILEPFVPVDANR